MSVRGGGRGVTATWRESRRHFAGKYRSASGEWVPKVVPTDIAGSKRDKSKALKWLDERAAAENVVPASAPKIRRGGMALIHAFEKWKELRDADKRTAPSTRRANGDLFKNVILREYTDAEGTFRLAFEDIVVLGTDLRILRRWIRAASQLHSAYRVRDAASKLTIFFDDAEFEKWFRGANPMKNEALRRELPAIPTQNTRGGIVFLPVEIANPLCASRVVMLMRRVRYLLLLTTGLREGEISGLRWGRLRIDIAHPRLEVEVARRLERDEGEELGPVKRQTSVGTLPLHDAAVAALLEWRDDEENGIVFLLGRSPRPEDPVFPSMRARDNGRFARPDTAENLRDDLMVSGLPLKDAGGRNFDAHACRRSFATYLQRAKVDKDVRRRLMRHGARDVTEDFYTSENWLEMVAAVNSLPFGWQTGIPYLAPAQPTMLQERVLDFLSTEPKASAPRVAEALQIRRSQVKWVMRKVQQGRLIVPSLAASVVSHVVATPPRHSDLLKSERPGTAGSKAVREVSNLSRESGLNRRPALYESVDGSGGVVASRPHVPENTELYSDNRSPVGTRTSTATEPVGGAVGGATKHFAPTGTVRVWVDGKVVAEVEAAECDTAGMVADRVAGKLRLKGIAARRVGDARVVVARARKAVSR